MKTTTMYQNGYEFQVSIEQPFLRFKGGGKAKMPPVPPPQAIPDTGPEPAEQAMKNRPRSRKDTFLTGDLVPIPKKKTVLG